MVRDGGRREMDGHPVEVGMTGGLLKGDDALPESSEMKGTGWAKAVAAVESKRQQKAG